jgi:hypothetical protein
MVNTRQSVSSRLADADSAAQRRAARNAALEDKALDWLDRMGETGMRLIDRIDRRSGGDMDEDEAKAFARVGDDCTAFVNVSRSVRRIIVLEQEVAGLREPSVRRGAYGPRAANGNKAPVREERRREPGELRMRGDPCDLYDYEDYEDYKKCVEDPFLELCIRVCAAIDQDMAGTEFEEDAAHDSMVAKIQKYAAITPHPALDAFLAEITPEERGQLYSGGLAQGPPPDPNDPNRRKFRRPAGQPP